MKQSIDIFEKLKRKPSIEKGTRQAPEIFFQLKFDKEGSAYIRVIDQKQNEVEVDYRSYSGHNREVLKSLENIKARNSFRIDWEKPSETSEKSYLSENEFLIWQLQKCDNFVDSDLHPLLFEPGHAEIAIVLGDEQNAESRIVLMHQGREFQRPLFLQESHVLADGRIFEIEPIGENFSLLPLFETRVQPEELERYLSLLYSYFDNITVRYKDYQQVEGLCRQTQPTLIFEKIDPDNSLYMRIANSLSGFGADFFDNYELSKVAVLNELEARIVISDVIQEDLSPHCQEMSKLLSKYKKALKGREKIEYFREDNLFIIEENLARELMHQELPRFLTRYSVFGAEKLKSYKIRASTPKLNLSLKHGIDFLEGEATLDIDGETIPLFEAISQYRKSSYIQLSDGTQAIINQAYISKLERIFRKRKDGVGVSFFDLPIVEELIEEKIAHESFKKSREIFLGFNRLNEARVPIPELHAPLRPYQEQGYRWLNYLHQHSLGGCLADDMGLGKTIEAIALLSALYPAQHENSGQLEQKKRKKQPMRQLEQSEQPGQDESFGQVEVTGHPANNTPSLVAMPKSLLYNWAAEISRFNPNLTYYIYYANNRDLEAAKKNNLILTTYGMIRNDIEKFKEEEFYLIILDESQSIKNIDSQISKAVMLLKSRHRLALSGTPIENNLGELYALFRFLNPAMFGSVKDFTRYYAVPIQQENDGEVVHELKKKIYPFILRRLKKDVLKDLPDKIEQTYFVEMSQSQKKLYDIRRLFYYQTVKEQIGRNGIEKSQFYIFQALSELRQIASIPESKSDGQILSPKREVLMENIVDSVANGHKILVFANFLSAIDYIAEDLEKEGIEYLVMTGATRDRQTLVDRFQRDQRVKVFLMTLKTGGVGLNLTAADTIFIFDPWWNRAAENQAVDRTHRIGQNRTVFSYRLITQASIEEKIMELQGKKSELFENIISADSASLKSLDETDIEFILG